MKTMLHRAQMELSGWGRYPRVLSSVVRPACVADVAPPTEGHMIARGQGRAYGNAATSKDGVVLLTEKLDRVLAFDEKSGCLTAEAGTTLAQVLEKFVPRGWFPSVTPGTKFVSLGGCVGADVHGKNHHHAGSFGAHVAELEIMLADGTRRRCSPEKDAELFHATVGGMGLTGVITKVSFQLIPVESVYMIVQHHRACNLDESLNLLEDEKWDDEYTVAWIDCLARGKSLGRSVLMRGHHAKQAELPVAMREPLRLKRRGTHNLAFDLPSWALNSLTVALFNNFYYAWQGAKKNAFIADYDSYFYPLDRLGNWNRLYGARGFVQYQCVLPTATARRGLKLLLETLAETRRASFLAVLKRFGAEGRGLLSFPLAGYTLALDMPLGDAKLFEFLERLDEIVLEHGGRVYLAKDARVRPETFRRMYPRFDEWLRIKTQLDANNCWRSDLARELNITT
ncbi:MAG: FAD-binding protein [Pyrinomonadaceae bacterium]